ncbi:MAG: BrnA antitoxin family protein [Bryobacteraceae bacterium]|nr:BrnA antitoxin family protein [Bryobacteraceae bacterium]
MRTEYDFSKSRKNPYAQQLKRPVTIRLDTAAVAYFKQLAAELGMPYQNLINLFLRDCAMRKRRPSIEWLEASAGSATSTPATKP